MNHRGVIARAGNERGTALLMILMALFALGLMSMVIAQIAATEVAISANIAAGARSFLPADGASEVLLRDVVDMSRSLGRFPTDAELATIQAPTFTDVTLSEFTAYRDGAEVTEAMTTGLFVGLSADKQPFIIRVTAESAGPPASSTTIEIEGEFAEIPIFQFGVLYEHDLDLHPGPAMTFAGRIHSNEDIFLDPGSSLTINAPITTAGGLYNAHQSGYTSGGTVAIMDSEGNYTDLNGTDSSDPDWTVDALDFWDGRVRTGDLGGDRLDLILEDPTDPRLIIEGGRPDDTATDQAAKLYYEADLRILNGRAYDADGNLLSTTDPSTGEDTIRETIIYDWREEKYMLTVEVDMERLGRITGFPANGTVFVGAYEPTNGMPNWPAETSNGVGPAEWEGYDPPWSTNSGTEFAFKLTNGSELAAPTTMISENPVYVKGDFNTVNKKGAAIMADAVTILSNDWSSTMQSGGGSGGGMLGTGDSGSSYTYDDDLNYSLQSLSDRPASATTLNAAIMTGNVDMGSSYNGGLENLPRFLERWSGVTLNLNGSLVALWRSELADGTFGKSNVYSAPNRNWAFDTDLLDPANLPPFSPTIYTITVTSWDRY